MKKTQKGFAHLALLLLLVVVAVAAYAGYKVVKNHQKVTTANQTSTSVTQSVSDTINSQGDLNKAVNTLNDQNVDGDLNPGSLDNDVNSLL
jgi:predicted negative regulator of RcsB-dependent stress response